MKKMDALRGEAALAFSMGGAIWKDGKEGRFLSEQAAAALAEQYGKVPQRMKPARPSIFPMKPMDTP